MLDEREQEVAMQHIVRGYQPRANIIGLTPEQENYIYNREGGTLEIE